MLWSPGHGHALHSGVGRLRIWPRDPFKGDRHFRRPRQPLLIHDAIMSLSNSSLNGTMQGVVLVALYDNVASSDVPLLLLESFTMGTRSSHFTPKEVGRFCI